MRTASWIALLVVAGVLAGACEKSTAQYEKELRTRNARRFWMLRSDAITNNDAVFVNVIHDSVTETCIAVFEDVSGGQKAVASLGQVPCR